MKETQPAHELTFPKSLRKFLATETFSQLYTDAAVLISQAQSEPQITPLHTHFRGASFQNIAFLELSKKCSGQPDTSLLSSAQTLRFLKKINPSVIELPFPFGLTALRMPTPDFLLVKHQDGQAPSINKVFESTTTLWTIEQKKEGFAWLKDVYPQYFQNAQLVFITPKNRIINDEAITNMHTSFDSDSFMCFARFIWNEYRTDCDAATLQELEKYTQTYNRLPTKGQTSLHGRPFRLGNDEVAYRRFLNRFDSYLKMI